MDLGRIGVWWSGSRRGGGGLDADAARTLEDAGYGAIWSSGGFDPGLAPRFAQLLAATERLVVASGIVSIWVSDAGDLARQAHALREEHAGRFLLGLGASHGPIVTDYQRPYSRMVAYLDELDAATPTVQPTDRVLAALGPRMLRLSATRSAGAHPYFVPVEHTTMAREVLGAGPLLAPEVTVVVEPDPARAREVARRFTAGYLALPNYANNLRRLGFGEDDLAGAGSDRLVDAVVAWGDLESVADRVRAHLEAGADHVCLQVLSETGELPLDQYRALARALL